MLNWLERMMHLRTRSPEFGDAACEWLDTRNSAVLAHCCSGEQSSVIAVHNLSGKPQNVEIRLSRKVAALFDLLHNREHEIDGPLKLNLTPYGYLWLREGRGPESLASVTE
jgi:maltose alpha-D-glucosyltransferase / alpha-amylase